MEPLNLDLNIPLDAWQISTSIIGAGEKSPSLTNSAVRSIEMRLLRQGWPAGASLGSFRSLRKQLGLGRPACREVITILMARGLVDVKHGRSGGFFVASPVLDEVVGAILMHLAVTGAPPVCISEFRVVVWRMVVEAVFHRPHLSSPWLEDPAELGFAANLAAALDNPLIAVAAHL
jgi:hypothetical protein